jgi:peptidoglycan/LPS O-acetylase OafA/YrhL
VPKRKTCRKLQSFAVRRGTDRKANRINGAIFISTSLVLYVLLLINQDKHHSLVNYSAKWLTYLGTISYGVYLFHYIAILLVIKACTALGFGNFQNTGTLLLVQLFSLLLAIVLGMLSYHTIESYF